MKPHRYLFVSLLFLLLGTKALASITYQILPRDGKQDAWSLDGGSITTDGTLGEIDTSNFESWELHFTSPAGESVISSITGEALEHSIEFNILDGVGNYEEDATYTTLIAKEDRLTFSVGKNDIYSLFFSTSSLLDYFNGKAFAFFPLGTASGLRFVGDNSIIGPGIFFDNDVDSSIPIHPLQDYYFGIDHPNTASLVDSSDPSEEFLIGTVGTVPEAYTIILLTLCSLGYMLQRNRTI